MNRGFRLPIQLNPHNQSADQATRQETLVDSQFMSLRSVRSLHSSLRLYYSSDLKLTLFSKDNCGLCDKAKDVMGKVLKDNQELERKAVYTIVDIDDPANKDWWEKYCFDIPVLHIEDSTRQGSLLKIFHRLDEKDVVDKINSFK
ncbi:hypothetical protein HG536_0E03440 [Torulaspora globosa]|uniref:Glutaredoxin-like protein n=1 Tax=Torulaspora globosa TaxID=48254 RepID=A0A7G3ZIU7_9SACH|nr:uncharacterized protein HG536_0E03440 [Torulaspora globosa]QLL33433.1 hypothetical protein HG536_0E03440 [Torulaspora globosa]